MKYVETRQGLVIFVIIKVLVIFVMINLFVLNMTGLVIQIRIFVLYTIVDCISPKYDWISHKMGSFVLNTFRWLPKLSGFKKENKYIFFFNMS